LATNAKKVHFARKGWNAVFKLLAQIMSSAPVQGDSKAIETFIELCDQLLNKIAESREVERRDYQHWVEEYNTTRDSLSEKLNEIIAEIANLEGEIAALNKRITNAQNEKAEQDQRAVEKQAQHDDKQQYCDDENIQYSERREQRDDDREVVSDTIGLLQSHLRLFKQYVSKRLTEVKKSD